MKKYLMIFLILGALLGTACFAVEKQKKNVALEFTLNYKPEENQPTEHVMKNTVKLADSKWMVAGKLVKPKEEDVLLFLVRQVSHKNNKYQLEFMIIDARNQVNSIVMPRVTAITGLPVQVVDKTDNHSIQLNVNVAIS
jgi:hypothetical protein